ncbi:MAG: hypothetical protein KJP08_10415 [Gammaproteobacteria bacterium]|nr:hypothetical protein [Gammaproteobacteria bacterium]NNF50252.1 hypothetical protein [Woeseiaceae bacterium]MBT8095214.1 hypothetical protein [Gammaproteobacteria bacterium]MBT8105372.1 hypothetical protein [Gammaproteobacteria bacterium]NNK25386.1 hypothetical protein [Woeseiaceae bacterium]
MEFIFFVAIAALIVWVVLRLRRNKAPQAPSGAGAKSATTRYHAVSIHYAEGACAAAKALSGQRYLANEAPRLPLPDCDAHQCRCYFAHHEDRRTQRDRRSPFGAGSHGGTSGFRQDERREREERRQDADEDL